MKIGKLMSATFHCSCGSRYVPEQFDGDGDHIEICGCKKGYIFVIKNGDIAEVKAAPEMGPVFHGTSSVTLRANGDCPVCDEAANRDKFGKPRPCYVKGCANNPRT
jgi:hypothetical protein